MHSPRFAVSKQGDQEPGLALGGDGGNEVWVFGEEGPGYIFFEPEEGFELGQYSLQVWINDELMTQSSVHMNNAIIRANN